MTMRIPNCGLLPEDIEAARTTAADGGFEADLTRLDQDLGPDSSP
jgi:hypothetical protein